ncbi:hypothetical protein [Mameliella sp.]|uniref:hypothetical protein n=1 Tax=Mameliella sp. TaxID=1924940 RepID=UPI003BA9F5ED
MARGTKRQPLKLKKANFIQDGVAFPKIAQTSVVHTSQPMQKRCAHMRKLGIAVRAGHLAN